MKRFALLLAVLSSTALLAAAAATADTFADPTGDAAGGPDIGAITVTNDAAGTVTISTAVALAPGQVVGIFLDTDLNGQVFDATGRAIFLIGAGPGVVLPLAFASDAAGNPSPTIIPSLKPSATSTTVDISFAKGDLGIDKGFGFWIGTFASSDALGAGTTSDEAPDGNAMYTYILTTPPPPLPPPAPVVKPVIGAPVATPASPQAGKRFSVVFSVTRSDDGAPLTDGSATCSASLAGKAIPCAKTLQGGSARLSFLLPKTAKGKQLKVKLTISAGDQTASKAVTFRVR